jgi:hypothetical protein
MNALTPGKHEGGFGELIGRIRAQVGV